MRFYRLTEHASIRGVMPVTVTLSPAASSNSRSPSGDLIALANKPTPKQSHNRSTRDIGKNTLDAVLADSLLQEISYDPDYPTY